MRALFFPILLALSLPAAAEDAASIGPGNLSCAEFARMYANDPEQTEMVFYAWAEGYMTGLNMALLKITGDSQNLTGKSGISGQKQEIRQFCNSQPLANYQQAVNSIYDALPANHKLDHPLPTLPK